MIVFENCRTIGTGAGGGGTKTYCNPRLIAHEQRLEVAVIAALLDAVSVPATAVKITEAVPARIVTAEGIESEVDDEDRAKSTSVV